MDDAHILDSPRKLEAILDLVEKNGKIGESKKCAEALIRDPALQYLFLQRALSLPYRVNPDYAHTLSRDDLVAPTQIFPARNSEVLSHYGDVLLGFEVRSREPITRIALVVGGMHAVWSKTFDGMLYVSLEESLDGLTIPFIEFMYSAFQLFVYSNESTARCSIDLYYSFLHTEDRRMLATKGGPDSTYHTRLADVCKLFQQKQDAVLLKSAPC
jgi:hypothetical protein